MDRRAFLKTGAACTALSAAPLGWAAEEQPGWRRFEVVTRVDLSEAGPARIWLPVPNVNSPYQQVIGNTYTAVGGNAGITQDPVYGAGILTFDYAGQGKAGLEMVSRIATRDIALDLKGAGNGAALPEAERATYLKATELIPTDGIVRKTALEITGGSQGDLQKAQAIYQWIVEKTQRNPLTRGCGVGDIRAMLESGNLSGKCADLNALFVGLARASGIPARDVYGIRVADSRLGYKSLGKAGDITKAQHCRAEFFLPGHGWVPVDPADVRKVVLEENGGMPLQDPKVEAARQRLFGSWEMNWMAYNMAHDLALPGNGKGPVGYFMYPQAELMSGSKLVRLDCLDPENFRYRIEARELVT